MKTPKPVQQVVEAHRTLLDPAVRRVKAMRLQTAEAGQALDAMLALIFPEWETGNFIYDPESGGFFKKGTKLVRAADPTNRPHSKRSGG